MTLFFLACLLAVLPAASMRSPIFGPRELTRVEGGSVSITCYYPDSSVNRHSRKYWCRQGVRGRCTTLISGSYVSRDYEGRANMTDFPESNMFVVDVGQLTQNDSGHYKCGLGISSQGLYFDVSLQVQPGSGSLNGIQTYTAEQGRTVTINCPFKPEDSMAVKSVCKMINNDCLLVIDSNQYVDSSYINRVRLVIQDTSQLSFSFVINRLLLRDSGIYVCKAGRGVTADKTTVNLQVLKPEPELLYADLRGSVAFDCDLGPEVTHLAKFLCRESNGEACETVVNTLGQRAEAFEGRILIIPKTQGTFSVHITGLRKEDEGRYLCGAHSDGMYEEGWPTQSWQLFVNEETIIPRTPSVIKGVVGGSVAMLCPYNPKDTNSVKFWCRWNKQSSVCPQLVSSKGLVKGQEKQYTGRLALFEEPGNGTFTVILNQLTPQDAGFYWCLTNRDTRWWSTAELKIVEGEPNLKAPEKVTASLGQNLKLACHWPCKFFSYEKYWCKWSSQGCQALPSQVEGPRQASTSCDQQNQLISLILNPVAKKDEGWYWCGVKEGVRFGDTVATFVEVKETVKLVQGVGQVNEAPVEKAVGPHVRQMENRVVQDPKLFAVDEERKDTGDPAGGSKASADPGSSAGHVGSSTVLVSTLVPLALVLALGAVAVGVIRARHRRNVDRISIRSYRTDISMSDFENSRDFGANDNMGAASVTQETSLEGKDEFTAPTEDAVETEEPKKAKRSSKEEADMAYTAFLLQANTMATSVQDSANQA